MSEEMNYVIYDRDGKAVLTAPESCRYPREIERSLQDAGYTIKLNGKKITKKETSNKED